MTSIGNYPSLVERLLWHEVGTVIAQDEDPLFLLGDIFKDARRILRVGNQNLILALQLQAQNLAQSRDATPEKESLIFLRVTLQLGDGVDDAMKASLFRGVDGDQWIAARIKTSRLAMIASSDSCGMVILI